MKYVHRRVFLWGLAGTISLLLFTFLPATSFAFTSSWLQVPSPNGPYATNKLSGVAALSTDNVWAVGSSQDIPGTYQSAGLIEHWNGHRISVIPSPTNSLYDTLTGIAAIASNDIWAVGSTSLGDQYGDTGALLEHWDGTTWKIVPAPLPPRKPGMYLLKSVVAIATNDVWAVGIFAFPFDNVPLALHWNGSVWSVVEMPAPLIYTPEGSYSQAQLYSVTAISSNDVWAVGTYDLGSFPVIEHWDGNTWNIIDAPANSGQPTALQSVSADSTGDLWIAGSSGGQPFIAQWNAGSWQVIPPPPSTTGYFSAIKVVNQTSIWAINGNTNIWHWDGTAWTSVPNAAPTNGVLSAIASTGSFVGAVGTTVTDTGADTLVLVGYGA